MKIHRRKRRFLSSGQCLFLSECNGKTMAEYYQVIYPQFDMERFREMVSGFGLEFTREAVHVSKGMETAGGTSSWRLCRNKISDM